MTNERNCENCAHARPFGGENDNRCDAWECEYIDRQEAIEAYKARRDIVRCGECKYSKDWYGDHCLCYLWAETGIGVFQDGYCSYGERRANEHNTERD